MSWEPGDGDMQDKQRVREKRGKSGESWNRRGQRSKQGICWSIELSLLQIVVLGGSTRHETMQLDGQKYKMTSGWLD
jgi:hypothetical protein